MIFHVCFVKFPRRCAFDLHHPNWCALRVEYKSELFIRRLNTEMFDVAASQAPAADKPIARSARPADFHQEPADASPQTQAAANHPGVSDFETMRIVGRNLNRRAGAICYSGSRGKHRQEPVPGDTSYQVIRAAQSKILSNVSTPARPRARFGVHQA